MDRCNSLDPNILEIGSNDGTLLFEFSKLTKGKIFGIDPAKNINEIARKKSAISEVS